MQQRDKRNSISLHYPRKRTDKLAFIEVYITLLSQKIDDPEHFTVEFLALMCKLEDSVRESLESEITVAEIGSAIDELGNGKSPGPDGL